MEFCGPSNALYSIFFYQGSTQYVKPAQAAEETNSGIIIGVVIGCVLLIVVVFVILYLVRLNLRTVCTEVNRYV